LEEREGPQWAHSSRSPQNPENGCFLEESGHSIYPKRTGSTGSSRPREDLPLNIPRFPPIDALSPRLGYAETYLKLGELRRTLRKTRNAKSQAGPGLRQTGVPTRHARFPF
jgi:hypothetical protein